MCSEKGQWRGCSRRLEGLINLDSFSLIPVPWAMMPHAPCFSSWCLLRTGCECRRYCSRVFIGDVWSNFPFFHSVFPRKTSFEVTVRWLLSEKGERNWKMEVLSTKHLPLQVEKTFPSLTAHSPGWMSDWLFSSWVLIQELKETVVFLLRRNTYLLSEWEQSLWTSHSISKMAQLLARLICSHLKGHGSHQQAGPHQANGKPPQVLVTDLLSASHSLACLLVPPTSWHNQQDDTTFCFSFSLSFQYRADSFWDNISGDTE